MFEVDIYNVEQVIEFVGKVYQSELGLLHEGLSTYVALKLRSGGLIGYFRKLVAIAKAFYRKNQGEIVDLAAEIT